MSFLSKMALGMTSFLVSTVSVLLLTVLFAPISLDELVPGIMGDIYHFADSGTREKVDVFIMDQCSTLRSNPVDSALLSQLTLVCNDPQKMAELEATCKNPPENMVGTCVNVNNGYFKTQCQRLITKEKKTEFLSQASDIHAICNTLERENIRGQEAFSMVAAGFVPKDDEVLDLLPSWQATLFRFTNMQGELTLYFIMVLGGLLAMLYLLDSKLLHFGHHIGLIMVKIGLFFFVPPLILSVYMDMHPPDTSWILDTVLGESSGLPPNMMMKQAFKDLAPLTIVHLVPNGFIVASGLIASLGICLWFLTRHEGKDRFHHDYEGPLLSEEEEKVVRKELGLKDKTEPKKTAIKKETKQKKSPPNPVAPAGK